MHSFIYSAESSAAGAAASSTGAGALAASIAFALASSSSIVGWSSEKWLITICLIKLLDIFLSG